MKHLIEFVPYGTGKAKEPPDPRFPLGVFRDVTQGKVPSCSVNLPYPAPECGYFVVRCALCQFSLAITAAGRPDDPVQVKIPCDLAHMDAGTA